MPPLTPTLSETQAPLITPGSFPGLPKFATKVQEALDLVNPSDMKLVVQKKQEIEQQKAHLTTLLEDLKFSQKDYDFSNYEERLLLSDLEIENILEMEIFRKDGELTELGMSFYEYLKVLTEGKSDELKRKMKTKLVKEFELEDRVYESSVGILWGTLGPDKIIFQSKKQFFQDIQKAGYSGIKSIDLNSHSLCEKLEVLDFIELVNITGLSGIKSVDLSFNRLSEKLEVPDLFKLVQQAGLSGIRHLNLGNNHFGKKFKVPDFLELLKQAQLSGIRDLGNIVNEFFYEQINVRNFLDFFELLKQTGFSSIKSLCISNLSQKFFTPHNIIKFVGQAGYSGIRNLDISQNNLYEILNTQDFLELVKIAGLSGIKSLDLRANSLYEILDTQDFLELVKIAGLSGIKSFTFSYNGFPEKLEVKDFLIFIKTVGESGIRGLDLGCSDLYSYDASSVILFIKTVGESGIGSLDISKCDLSRIFKISDLFMLIQTAGKSGIRSLDLQGNSIADIIKTPLDFIELVRQAGFSGIRNLDFSKNGLSGMVGFDQKVELDIIVKEFNLKLKYHDNY